MMIKNYTLPTTFHNIEQESGSKSRVRALTRDPTQTQIADPLTRDPETRFHLCNAVQLLF